MPDELQVPPVRPSAWDVPPWLDRSARWTWRLLVLAVGLYLGLWVLGSLRVVLVPVFVALLLTALSMPLATFLMSRRVPRLVAAWVTLATVIGTLWGVGYLVFDSVRTQLWDGTEWQEVDDEIRRWLRTGPAGLSDDQIEQFERQAQDALIGGLRAVGVSRAGVVAELFGGIVLAVVLFFFFVKDGPTMWNWITHRIRPARRDTVDRGGRAAFSALASYMRGVAITGVVDAVAIGIALAVIGVPMVIPLAMLTFFAAFFPIVGATLAGGLATVVALVTNGPGDAALVALATLAVQQIEGDLVMPLVMRRQVSLHPAVILVVLAFGGAIAGIVGAFVAVPVAAMVAAASGAIADHRRSVESGPVRLG